MADKYHVVNTIASESNDGGLEKVRDLLFGKQVEDFRQQIGDLKQALGVDIAQANTELSNFVSRQDEQNDNLARQVSEQVDALRNEINLRLDLLDKRMLSQYAELADTVTAKIRLQDQQKVDRADLAAMFTRMAEQLNND